MSSRNLVSRFFSRPALLTTTKSFPLSGRCLGIAACAKLRGSQHVLSAPEILPNKAGSFFARLYSAEPENLDSAEIDYYEFQDVVGRPYMLVIDVREPQELKEDGRIPGTLNIPLGEVDSALSEDPRKIAKKYHLSAGLPPGGPNMVFLCKAGVRAAKAVTIAKKHGYDKARFYKGSFLDWKERGGSIIKGQ